MTITIEEINAWRSAPSERNNLEFKEAKTQFDWQKLLEYSVAIANEGGGRLILGVADKRPRAVVGTQACGDPPGAEKKLFDTLGFRVDVEAVSHPDGRVVVCTIPSRSRGTAFHLEGKYLMRSGASLVPMSEDMLRRIFAEGKPDWLASDAAVDVAAEAIVDLLDTQAFFDFLKMPYPATRTAVIDRLVQERLVDGTANGFSISRLAAISFAKNLDRFDDLRRKAPRVIVYDGKSKVQTKRDQLGTRGYAVGFEGLIQFVLSQLPSNEIIGDALRREVPMFPPIMIREMIANALIHQDFEVGGASVSIEIYDDRVEISNPGRPTVLVERFIDEYRSRNERLADLMRRIGVCEEKGSGIDKVVDAAEGAGLPAPDFRSDNVRTTCILYGPRPFAEMGRDDRIRACYQHSCLRYVTNATMSNNTLRKRFGLPNERAETVSRILRETVDADLIKPQDAESGSKRFAQYVPFWA